MQRSALLTSVLGLTLLAGACTNPDYKPDPSVELCNVGGPLSARELKYATEPNPPAVQGRPPECRMGPDGVMRLPSPGAR
jgi:hypothetical protein